MYRDIEFYTEVNSDLKMQTQSPNSDHIAPHNTIIFASIKASTAVMFEIEVFWVVTP
jgi:hypothetical protein